MVFVVCCSLFLFVGSCSVFVVCQVLSVVCCLLFGCLLLGVWCLVFVVIYML